MVFDGGEHEPTVVPDLVLLVEWSEALMHHDQTEFIKSEFELRPLLMKNRY